jgi:8-oxo-dGTP pyrophosphatase MutT (NUDIX family)
MFCNNCGGKGHLFRTCKDPILSCGIILVDQENLPLTIAGSSVLMVRRKDSMSFAEFMRGKYDPTDADYVGRLLGNMTMEEQTGVLLLPFDDLWRTMWNGDSSSPDYAMSHEKFGQLNRGALISANKSPYPEPEWGFPKGRRIRGESDLDCAIREFSEETNIARDSYVVLKNIKLEETFRGLNNIEYRHVYFVALLKSPDQINLFQRFTPMQRREISAIAWKSFDECEGLVRPHHLQRMEMLGNLRSIVETFETM